MQAQNQLKGALCHPPCAYSPLCPLLCHRDAIVAELILAVTHTPPLLAQPERCASQCLGKLRVFLQTQGLELGLEVNTSRGDSLMDMSTMLMVTLLYQPHQTVCLCQCQALHQEFYLAQIDLVIVEEILSPTSHGMFPRLRRD